MADKFKYFIDYLENNKEKRIELTFSEIEDIMKEELCASARKYTAYWNPSGHSFPTQIINAGYNIKSVNLVNETIVLVKR